MITLRAGSATDVGLVRSNNQDQLLVADPLFAVADGMGGAAAGEVASATAVNALEEEFAAAGSSSPDLLIQAAQAANRAVWEKAEAHPEMRGMGTTLVALALVNGDRLAIVNVGDSRLYAMHAGDLRQVTSDHNLVAEMVAQGRISQEEAEVHPRRNIMTRALGVDPDVPIDLFVEDAVAGDRYLLCSDGLPREVKDELIASLLRRLADPAEAARELVEEAKRRGGNDNITVFVVDVVDSDQADRAEHADQADPAVGTAGDETTGLDSRSASTGDIAPAQTEAAEAAEAPPTRKPRRRFLRRRRPAADTRPTRPTNRMITPRVVGFVVLLLVIIGAAAAGVAWYARSSYFVGVRDDQLVIFKGRPGAVLWFRPTIAQETGRSVSDILAADLPKVQSGVEEPSLAAAQGLVARMVQAKLATATTTPTSTSTVPAPPTTAAKPG
jgi:PPM family protein phosphatase